MKKKKKNKKCPFEYVSLSVFVCERENYFMYVCVSFFVWDVCDY